MNFEDEYEEYDPDKEAALYEDYGPDFPGVLYEMYGARNLQELEYFLEN